MHTSQGCQGVAKEVKGYSISFLQAIVKGFAALHLLRNIAWSEDKRSCLVRTVQRVLSKQASFP